VISVVDHANMMEVVNNGMDNIATVITYSIQNVKLRLNEAIHIFHALNKEIPDIAKVVAKILPRMVSPTEARSLMMQVINFDRVALNRLQATLGNSLYPIIGIYNGYYDLDLANENDRICISKLLAQSQHMKEEMMKRSVHKNGTTGDLSQIGDWSSFRNERIDNIPIRITVELFNPMPREGLISFDFCGDDKPKRESMVMKDLRCINLITNLGLVDKKDRLMLEKDLIDMNTRAKESFAGDGHYQSVNNIQRAQDIQLCMCKFYSRLDLRSEQYAAAIVLEEEMIMDRDFLGHFDGQGGGRGDGDEDSDSDGSIESLSHCVFQEEEKLEIERQSSLPDELIEMTTLTRSQQVKAVTTSAGGSKSDRRGALQSGQSPQLPQAPLESSIPQRKRSTSIVPKITEKRKTSVRPLTTSPQRPASALSALTSLQRIRDVDESDIDDPGSLITQRDVVGTGNNRKQIRITNSRKFVVQSSQSLFKMKKNAHSSYNAKCAKIVKAMTDIITRIYIQARHLALIIKWFRLGRTHKTRHFGTYRVELVVLLFSRVLDIHNMDLVFAELAPFEVACVTCRLGILHFFNPLKPEGSICLNLAHHDERIVAKILALLSTLEPGENWLEESFRWEFTGVPVPGWELTQVIDLLTKSHSHSEKYNELIDMDDRCWYATQGILVP
jgi:hypothetical protein